MYQRMRKTTEPRLGRPPKDDEAMLARINIRVPQKVMRAIESVRDKREDGAETAQVIREVIVRGLKSMGEL